MNERLRRVILWAKLAIAAFEIAAGVLLLIVRFAHVDVAHVVSTLAAHELRQDPTDYLARHATLTAPSAVARAASIGALLIAYGALKAGLIVGVLRRYRRLVFAGAAVFAVIALAAFAVLVTHPTVLRVGLGLLDVAVAVVVILEARDLKRAG